MRDIAITIIVFGLLPVIIARPYIGILLWSWLSYMNPHRLAWGFAFNMPFAQITAITLFISLLFSKERLRVPITSTTVLWMVFLLWMCVTTVFALDQDSALEYLIRIIKIQIVTILTLVLITDMERLRKLLWIIVGSIGFFSVKGGAFTLLTGGAYRVWGPPDSFIEENNSLALATLMIIPLMFYLYKTSPTKWIRVGLMSGIVLSLFSALGSQSRGALLAIMAVGFFFWLKSGNKLLGVVFLAVFGVLALSFMPDSWHERMSTIQNYEEDASAMGRINAWTYSFNVANHRLTGGGLESWSGWSFAKYNAPDPTDVHAAHSIYFSVLADHGWPGLIFFLSILWLTWKNLKRISRFDRDAGDMALLAKMIQISLVAYMSGGAFLSLSYFDLPWHLFAITVLLGQFLQKYDEEPEEQPLATIPGKKTGSQFTLPSAKYQ